MKNNLGLGILMGAIAPLIAYLLATYTGLTDTLAPEKPMLVYVIAVFINFVALRFLFKREQDALAKGILVATFAASILYILTQRLSI
ncbi:hypothetical protein ACFX5U_22280 [Sphingobacterium sp. SG20118]|uniref:hypothetical protein n=1 Tax=Sphingobacterium sp. SG20118 TaxID=3367156 RepID=UPI0037DFC920